MRAKLGGIPTPRNTAKIVFFQDWLLRFCLFDNPQVIQINYQPFRLGFDLIKA